MNQAFVDAWFACQDTLRAKWAENAPIYYKDLVRDVISLMPEMDPERVHEINDGEYQGWLVYVIGAKGYQPSTYWCIKINYGSCSACDTLDAVNAESDAEKRTDKLMTLGLHVVQGLRLMFEDEP
jgi:hypothetical protein